MSIQEQCEKLSTTLRGATTRVPPYWALTYPLGAVLCLGMTLDSMRRLFGWTRTTWRGTTYAGGA